MGAINLEFRYLFNDYFKTIESRDFTFNWIIPAIITLIITTLIPQESFITAFNYLVSNAGVILTVLIGFSIASISILVASSSESVKKLKIQKSRKTLSGQKVSLFKLLLINLIFVVIIELITLFLLVITSFVQNQILKTVIIARVIFGIELYLLSVALFINITNTTNIYLSFFREDQDKRAKGN